jgi:beta-N-acetylglucosaminidase
MKWEGRAPLQLDYTDDLRVLDKNVSKMDEFKEVLGVQCAWIGLKINVEKTKSIGPGFFSKKVNT